MTGPLGTELIVVSDHNLTGGRAVLDVLHEAVAGGARAVLVRDKDLPRSERVETVDALRRQLAPLRGVVLVASDAGIDADGVHLASDDPWPAGERPAIVGRSCHDLDSVQAAEAEGCDYVTLSPIFPSPSKPGHGPPVGIVGLDAIARTVGVPVVALGGIRSGRAALARRHGAAAVAVMGHIMRAPDPARAVHGLLHELGSCTCDLHGLARTVEPQP